MSKLLFLPEYQKHVYLPFFYKKKVSRQFQFLTVLKTFSIKTSFQFTFFIYFQVLCEKHFTLVIFIDKMIFKKRKIFCRDSMEIRKSKNYKICKYFCNLIVNWIIFSFRILFFYLLYF